MVRRAALAALALAACYQPGSGSYFAHPGHFAHTAPTPRREPARPLPADKMLLAQCWRTVADAKALVDSMLAQKGVRVVDNTVEPYADVERRLDNAGDWAELMAQVHPDPQVRDAARTCGQQVQRAWSELWLDYRVYAALKAVDTSLADAETKRFVASVLRDMRRSGVELDDKGRARIREIDEQITKLSQQFEQNVAEDVRSIVVKDPAQLAGLPPDWIAAHKPDASGAIKITTDYPDYIPFLTYANDDDLRKQLYIAFRSRGDAHNGQILHDVLALRAEKALLLGFKDWADYESDDKMLRGGKAAQDFLDRVQRVAAPRARKDYAELLAQLRTHDPKATEVAEWQKAWLENEVKRGKYAVDAAEVRKYFEYQRTLGGLLAIASTIYDVQFKPATDPRAWHPDVKVFDVMRKDVRLGRVFLDMHPRAGKFKHAAEFPISEGVHGVQLPEAALVCNLPDPRRTAEPALLDHSDVVTMFHEFGHLMHAILGGDHHFARQSGVATERDFVEAPSEMFEEWAWSYDTLSQFAKNEAGDVIPKDLVDKMRRADRFGKGTWVLTQLLYAAVSLRYHQDDPSKLDQLGVYKALQKKYLPFAFVDGTQPQASFEHLIGYSSMYYTYLWSLVIARDLLTPFAAPGKSLMATDVTYAFRDKVLAPGGTKDAAELVKDFLGRPWAYKAFEKYLSE